MNGFALALLALIPLTAGTTPHESSGDAITVALCNGGEITIDLGTDEPKPKDDDRRKGCQQEGCHAGACREKHKAKPARAI